MSKLILIALLLTTSNAHAATKREIIVSLLQEANLTVDMTSDTGCKVLELPDKLVIYCEGEKRAAQYRRVMQTLVEHNPVDKYNSVFNSGHVEVR